MPAVSVSDALSLPRLPTLAADVVRRPVARIVTATRTFEGEGFPVRRPFPTAELPFADPFMLLDHMGAVDYPPGEAKGTAWHPHRGFETVTYIIDGAFQHRDSHGGGGLIADGDTQWMTAGSGLLHIEVPPAELVASGGLFHGVQLWVNLPAGQKWVAPSYQGLRAADLGLLRSGDGGALVRVIAGSIGGVAGPGSTHTPITYAHATLAPGAELELPWDPGSNALVYVLDGTGSVGPERAAVTAGQLAVHGAGDAITLRSEQVLDVLLLGGRPLREPVARYGPFVMNTQAEIRQAVQDFQSGLMGEIPADWSP
jgi:redox-sensitive bicupin YhaK (pirin superfamily)